MATDSFRGPYEVTQRFASGTLWVIYRGTDPDPRRELGSYFPGYKVTESDQDSVGRSSFALEPGTSWGPDHDHTADVDWFDGEAECARCGKRLPDRDKR